MPKCFLYCHESTVGGKKQEILLSDCGWTQEKHGRTTTEWGNEMEDEVS